MKRYIYGSRNGIYAWPTLLRRQGMAMVCNFPIAARSGGNIPLLSRPQARRPTAGCGGLAASSGCILSTTVRWLGGMLTNYDTIWRRIQRLRGDEREEADGTLGRRTKLEQARMMEEKDKLERNLGGIWAI